MARARQRRRSINEWKDRARRAARACVARGRGLSRRRNPQPRDRGEQAATIAFSSTATAFRGRTSSRRIARLPNAAGSSPATASCCPKHSPTRARETPSRSSGASRGWSRRRGINRPARSAFAARAVAQGRPQRWQGVRTCNLAVWRAISTASTGSIELRGLGSRGFRPGDPPDPRPSGARKALCHRRVASLAPRERPLGIAANHAQLDEAIRGDRVRALRGSRRCCAAHARSAHGRSSRPTAAALPERSSALRLRSRAPCRTTGSVCGSPSCSAASSRSASGTVRSTPICGACSCGSIARRSGCEKNALFTPQMFDMMERGVLADAIAAQARRNSPSSTSAPMSDSIRSSSHRARRRAHRSRSSRNPVFSNVYASISRPTLTSKVDVRADRAR